MRATSRLAAAGLAALAALPLAADAFAEVGTKVEDRELRTVAGRKERLFAGNPKATVLVFVRTGNDRSALALKELAACEKALAGKPVRWAAVLSASEPLAEAQAELASAGAAMPLLLDDGDALYAALGVRLHPTLVFLDAKHQVVAFEGFRQVEYCDLVETRVRVVLGELPASALDRVLNPAVSTLPGEDPSKKAMRDVKMAAKLVDLGSYDLAIAKARRALELAPVAAGWAVLGDAYRKKGDCPAAAKAYASALALDAKEARALEGRKACP